MTESTHEYVKNWIQNDESVDVDSSKLGNTEIAIFWENNRAKQALAKEISEYLSVGVHPEGDSLNLTPDAHGKIHTDFLRYMDEEFRHKLKT